jgi:hypothetical protein
VFLNTENISAFVGFSWKINEIEMHGATMKIKLLKSWKKSVPHRTLINNPDVINIIRIT